MIVAHLAMIAVLGLAPEGDPAALVDRLGSPRFAEREAAAASLERLGRRALPSLHAALEAKDPEVKTRAEVLAVKIERDLMVRPTTLTLDFRDRPLEEVVQALTDRSGIVVALQPDNPVFWQNRRITLRQPEAVSFWTAIDRLCQAAGLSYSPTSAPGPGGRRLVLQAGTGNGPFGPTAESGPFRITLLQFEHQRTLGFAAPEATPTVNVQFSASLLVVAEPRLIISQNGPVKLLEAVDDRGQSLLQPSSPGPAIQRFSGYSGYNYSSNPSSLQLQVPLKLPEAPGRSVRVLRGSIPLAVSAPRPNPLLIPLAGAAGKTFRSGDSALTVHEVKDDPMAQRMTLDLTVRTEPRPGEGIPGVSDGFGGRSSELVQNRLEVLDARGKPLQAIAARNHSAGGETRLTLMLLQTLGGAPTQIRYFDLARATTEATFRFTGVPIP
ncbi:MAG TPA: hypothetical protein VF590_20635 [Isosphaeraceae bacterium]